MTGSYLYFHLMGRVIKKVIAFGTFDVFHKGHDFFLKQAKKAGEYLIVVVARDASAAQAKGKKPSRGAIDRLATVLAHPAVNEACLGDNNPRAYATLSKAEFDIVALGYDQKPSLHEAKSILERVGRPDAAIVQIPSYYPERYKSSKLRDSIVHKTT
jgi:cytidyltransferase-like protein